MGDSETGESAGFLTRSLIRKGQLGLPRVALRSVFVYFVVKKFRANCTDSEAD